MSAFSGTFWDIVRPIHGPVTRALRRRLGREYFHHPEMELPPAYEAVQIEVERKLHHYLHIPPSRVRQIVIVGANDGSEIHRLRRSYPECKFLCFEPSPKWFAELTNQFGGADYVESRELALGSTPGLATFHELPLAGNGSLLEPDRKHWAEFTQVTADEIISFDVQVSVLDVEASSIEKIDLLWMDVQGAEGAVLKGAHETLARTDAVFMEVALRDSPYRGAMLFSELDDLLSARGFSCVGLGADSRNYAGNALWVHDIAGRK